jgi:RNA polymerase sigma-70 factor, ECF subfamily
MSDDQAIIARVLHGDTEAFRVIVERYRGPVISMVAGLLGERGSAEDIAQDVFLAAYRHLAVFDPTRSAFSTWLFTIARNKCINAAQKRRAEPLGREVDTADSREPSDDLTRDDLHRALDEALAALPADQRSAFVLAEIEELPYAAIARIEGVRIGTVRSRINRAKAKLRAMLGAIQEDRV